MPSTELNENDLTRAFTLLSQDFDEKQGGFGQAPKFPIPHHLNFLLRYWKRTGDEKALSMVEKTLRDMRRGGIFDHVGLRIPPLLHRPRWLLPHFEKMLYDQALIAWGYLEAFLVTKRPFYLDTAEEIFTYVLRDMTSSPWCFFLCRRCRQRGHRRQILHLDISRDRNAYFLPKRLNWSCGCISITREGNFQDETGAGSSDQNIPHRVILGRNWHKYPTCLSGN